MLGAVFGFRGRINRLSYFLGSFGLGLAFVVAVVVAVLATLGTDGLEALQEHPAQALPALTILLIALIVAAWIGLSLQVRRIRDMGFPPAIVVPAMMIYGLVDHGAAAAMSGNGALGAVANTPIYPWINLAYTGALLFWPSKADDGVGPAIDWDRGGGSVGRTPRQPRAKAAPAMRPADAAMSAAAPARTPTPMFQAPPQPPAQAAGAVRFGRRGL